jgi:hypothetical protein
VKAGATVTQPFVLQSAPGAGSRTVRFGFERGSPSDGSRSIPIGADPGAWRVGLPASATYTNNKAVSFWIKIPANAPAGLYTGAVVARVDGGQTLRVPVFAAVAMRDPSKTAGNAPGPQARIASAADVFAKGDTFWPSVVGTPSTGSSADWLVYPVDLAGGLRRAVLSVYDAAAGDETYDLYLYESDFDLVASTHPFLAPGVTDQDASSSRPASTQASPQTLELDRPRAGRYYLAVSRARVGGSSTGDFGAFVLTLDEIA